MYRLFCEQNEEWAELITIQTLMEFKPWWVAEPKPEVPPPPQFGET